MQENEICLISDVKKWHSEWLVFLVIKLLMMQYIFSVWQFVKHLPGNILIDDTCHKPIPC